MKLLPNGAGGGGAPAPRFVDRVRSGLAWSLLESWSVQGLQFAVFVIVARHVHAEALGLVAIALLVGQLFQVTILNGIATPLVRMREVDPVLEHTAFWIALSAGLTLVGLTALLAPLAEAYLGHPGLAWVLTMLSITNLINSLNVVPQAALTRGLKMRSLALRSTASATGGGIVGISLAVMNYGVTAIVCQNIAAAALGSTVLWRASHWRPALHFSRTKARHVLRYGRNITLTGVIDFFNANSDTMVIGLVLGPAATGVYTVGKRALLAANLLLARGFSRIALPTFSQLRHDPPRLAYAYLRVVSSTALVTTPAFLGLALIAPEFITVFFGPRWPQAASVMRALTLFGAVQAIGIYNQSLMLAMDKPHWQTRITLTYAVVNIVTFFAAVHAGIVAVAIAFTARAYLLYPLSVHTAVRLLPIRWRDYGAAIRLPVLASLWMVGCTAIARQAFSDLPPLPLMVGTILLGGISYAVAVAVGGRPAVREVVRFARGQQRPA